MSELILVDGTEAGSIAATDSTVLRGDGCFEAIRSYGGRLFALDDHLARLGRSADALELPTPDMGRIAGWCRTVAGELGDGVVRVVVSRGDAVPGGDQTPRVVVLGHGVDALSSDFTMATVEAPWHPAGRAWALAGAKTVSYAPNLSASRVARAAGADDALLVSTEGVVLEGPTFSVAWVVDGVMETPGLDLLVLDSITRRHVLALARGAGLEVEEGSFTLDRLDAAEEVMALSTVKEVTAVRRVDDRRFEVGPVTEMLRSALYDHIERDLDPVS